MEKQKKETRGRRPMPRKDRMVGKRIWLTEAEIEARGGWNKCRDVAETAVLAMDITNPQLPR